MVSHINDKYYYKPTHITYAYDFKTMKYQQLEIVYISLSSFIMFFCE